MIILGTDKSVTDLIGGYMAEIEKLQSRLIESDQMYQQLKKQQNSPRNLKNSTSTVGKYNSWLWDFIEAETKMEIVVPRILRYSAGSFSGDFPHVRFSEYCLKIFWR